MQSFTSDIQCVTTVSMFALLFATAPVRAGEMNWGTYAHAHTRVCEFADCGGNVQTSSDTVEGVIDDGVQEQIASSSAFSEPSGFVNVRTYFESLTPNVYSFVLDNGSTSSVAGGAVEGVTEALVYYTYSGPPIALTIHATLTGEVSGPLSGADNTFDGISGTVQVFQDQLAIDAINLNEVGAELECVFECYFPDEEMSVQLDQGISDLNDSATISLSDGDGFYVHGHASFAAAGGGAISNSTQLKVSFSYTSGLTSIPDGNHIDIDGDGVADSLDNCTHSSNPAQIDVDDDGFGNQCDPDPDNNCVVNFLDIIQYAQSFNTFVGQPEYNPLVDLDSNGNVGFVDYAIMVGAYLSPPGPSFIECVPVESAF